MARRSVRALNTTSAVLSATAMALVGAPAPQTEDVHLRLLPPPHQEGGDSAATGPALGGLGGLAMGKVAINAPAPMSKTTLTHTVRSGDTVWALARANGTTVAAIIDANGLNSNALIRVGQRLTIPTKGSTSTPPATSSPKPSTNSPKPTTPAPASARHTVRAGQTLSGIAAQYGTTTAKLASANKLANPNFIRVGQVLTIPGSAATPPANTGSGKPSSTPAPAPKPAPKPTPTPESKPTSTYTVKAGDTVWAIARAHGTTVAAIISTNSLSADGLIRVGQKLQIGGSGTTTTPPAQPTPNACKDLVPATFLHYTYSPEVVAAANENKCTLNAMDVPSREAMQNLVRQTALDLGVDPALALAVAFQESGFNQRAVSPANAIGTMQVIPSSGQWAGQLLGRSINLLDPHDNVAAGVAILRSLQRTFPDNFDHAIGAYYQGAGSVSRYGLAADTRNYVNAVKAHMSRFN